MGEVNLNSFTIDSERLEREQQRYESWLEERTENAYQIASIAKSKNLDFIVTAFDEEAYDFLKSLGINKFKFASHSLTNLNLLNYVNLFSH